MRVTHTFFCLLLSSIFWACGPSASPSSTLPQAAPEAAPSEQVDSIALARERITQILSDYYGDLAKQQVQASRYFAPQVEQFFSSAQMTPEAIARSLEAGYRAVEDRNISFSPASMEVSPRYDGGYIAVFEGVSSYVRVKDRRVVREPFRNQVAFDRDFRIVRYEAAPAANARLSQAADSLPPAVAELARRMLEGLKSGKLEGLDEAADPELGYFLVVPTGAYAALFHYGRPAEMLQQAPWVGEGLKALLLEPRQEALPDFSCEDVRIFSKEGSFLYWAPQPYSRLSDLMKGLNEAEAGVYGEESFAQARAIQQQARVQLIDTEVKISLYFGKVRETWRLLVVDMASYQCSA